MGNLRLIARPSLDEQIRTTVWVQPATGALELVDTGLSLPADTNWHTIEFIVDFAHTQFVSICVTNRDTLFYRTQVVR